MRIHGKLSEVTKVDITNLDSNITIEHEHIFKTMYDETKHWNQCTVCGEKQNENAHTIRMIWETGIESCDFNNFCNKTCTCGYSEIWHKPCVWDGKSYYTSAYKHAKLCKNCKKDIVYAYYLNTYGTGELYLADKGDSGDNGMFYCRKSDGTKLDCNNPGTCATCKLSYSGANHYLITNQDTGIISCRICNNEYGIVEKEIQRNSNIPPTYTVIDKINLKNGATYFSTEGLRDMPEVWETNTQTVSNKNSNGTQFTLTSIGKMKSTYKVPCYAYTAYSVNINGIRCRHIATDFFPNPDSVKPIINNITIKGTDLLVEWSKNKTITISGTENYCNTIRVEILDDNGISIYKGTTSVSNGKYSISCTPELEANTEGKIFTAIVTDACENSSTQEFIISKIDSIAPNPTSGTKVEGEWAKSKNFTFKATDEGIGNVSIAFNDIKDLQLANFDGNEYSREYEFTGDVYSPKELSVLYKDELGNASMQKITVDKLDNTAPNITNVSIHNNKLSITANDIKEGLGEGSGVSKYKYITSTEKLENPEIPETAVEVNSAENIIVENISEVKYIYAVAEDLVGNVSEVYEIEVPRLVLTSKVNLNVANGKGGIELDWSDYDLADKYFVIYRKQENTSEWEIIVPLEQKLTGGKYTDISANDKTNPSAPTINIEGKQENNNIEITQSAIDTGTKYSYYISAYDSTQNTILAVSNQI